MPAPLTYPLDLNAPGAIDALFAFHRSLFGDAKMEGDEPKPNDPPKPSDIPKQTPPDPAASTTDEDGMNTDAGRRALQRVRDEKAAADKRAEDAERELQAIRDKDLSETERARKEAETERTEKAKLQARLDRVQAIADHSVPKEYQDLVVGTDEASYQASAKRAAEIAARLAGTTPPPEVVPGSGTGGHEKDKTGGSVDAGRQMYKPRRKTSA